jgi:4-amino-4-deoxy-L-arabinose transferase-like glycosyltransferase
MTDHPTEASSQSSSQSSSPRPRRAVQIAILLAIVVIAAGLRLYRLADLPPGLFIDQAQYGLDAWRIAEGETLPVFVEGPGGNKERGREPLFMVLMAGVFLLMGPSAVAIKLTSALIGITTVWMTALAASRFLGARAGLCAGALIAVSRWHITFSRLGFRAVLAPLMVVAVALALGWLIARRSRRAAILFGVVVGAGFYTYPAYWSVPPALALAGLAALWERRATLRKTLLAVRPLLLAATTACVLTLAPLGIYAVTHADDLLARAREVVIVGEGEGTPPPQATTILDGVQRVLFMLHLRGDHEPRHNIPLRPMLDFVSGLLFLGGLVAIAKARWPRALKIGLVALWLLPLLPSAVTLAAPNALRAVAAIPAVCAIAAVGLDALARQLERLRSTRSGDRLATVAATAAIAIALGSAAVVNARDYFVTWGNLPVLKSEFSGDIPRFVDYLRELGGDADLVVCPYVYSSPNVRFLTLRLERPLLPLDGVDALLATASSKRDRVFVCDEPATNALIHRLYPRAQEIGRYAIYTMRTGRVIRVPNDQLRTRLQAGEEEQARYFIDRMNASFALRADEW